MAAFMFGAEPFEESQPGGSPRHSTASPDELNAFYEDMKRQETLQRQLSRGKSKSLWSRKSTRKANSTTPMPQKFPTPTAPPVALSRSERVMQGEKEEFRDKQAQQPVLSRSIIPDPLGELPAWFNKENKDWIAAPLPAHRMKYQLHNPVGPLWYQNHHLIPLSHLRPSGPPPSLFPPVFPSLTPSSSSDDTARVLSGTPPGSSPHTPNASQVGLDGRPRSRRTSQTAQDNVDLLDVTDPWGTNWHHQSPYDPISTDEHEDANTRLHLASTSTAQSGQSGQSGQSLQSAQSGQSSQARHKAATPSPLSQSTSALHVKSTESTLPSRKLSKSRPGLGSLLGSKDSGEPKFPPQPSAAVVFPSVEPTTSPAQAIESNDKAPERSTTILGSISTPSRLSVATSPTSSGHPKEKKEKRGSAFGRFARKFSILKRPDNGRAAGGSRIDDWHHVSTGEVKTDTPRRTVQERKSSEPLKRGSPSGTQSSGAQGTSGSGAPRRDAGHRSSASIDLETPLSIGKLTIANPDTPSSVPNTPMTRDVSLSSATLERVLSQAREEQPPACSPSSVEPDMASEKPPTPPPRDSQMTIASPPATLPPDSSPVQTSIPPLIVQPAEQVELNPATPPVPRAPTPVPSTPKSEDTSPTTVPQALSPPVAARPISDQTFEYAAAPALAFLASTGYIDDSPLSRASMVVNPPTPYTSPPLSLTNRTPSPPMSTLANPPTPRISPEPTSPKFPATPAVPVKSDRASPRDTSPIKIKNDIQVKDQRAKPASPATGRQTETFRLVRNHSGDATSGQATAAAGEQWEVVESSNVSRRNKTKEKERSSKSNDREVGNRRDQRRQEKSRSNSDYSRENGHSQHKSSHGHQQAANTLASTSSKGPRDDSRKRNEDRERGPDRKGSDGTKSATVSRSYDDSRRRSEDRERGPDRKGSDGAKSATASRSYDDARRRSEDRERGPDSKGSDGVKSATGSRSYDDNRRRSEDRDRGSDPRGSDGVKPTAISRSYDDSRRRSEGRERGADSRGSEGAKSAALNVNKPQPPPPPPTPGPPSEQRRQSVSSTRPTSELPSSAELNALRAREAWEMDRLYRGRSMHYGAEPNGMMSSPAPLPSSIGQPDGSNGELNRDNGSVRSAGHGSSHTSFMQTSFQGQPQASMYYSQAAVPPPPIIYSSQSSSYQPSHSLQLPSHHNSNTSYQSFANHSTSPVDSGQRPALTNPLPEPPRESSYEPPPLPLVLTDTRSGHSVDYWTKFTGVTTAH